MSRAKVREVLPDATIERQRTNSRKTCYLVRYGIVWLGSGDTPGAAWSDSWNTLLGVLREAVRKEDEI